MGRKLDPGKAPDKKTNRVDPEIQIPIAHVAMAHLVKEIDLLERLYEAADFTEVVLEVPEPGEDETPADAQLAAFLTKGKFFRAVSERNRAIGSQYTHIKQAAQAASGCIHPPGHNTESERKASKDTVEELTKSVKEKAAAWEKNKAELRKRVDGKSETLEKEDEEAAKNLLEL